MEKLGDRVRALRNYTGLTQEMFAKKCGLEQGNINHLERERARPLWETLQKIITAFPECNPEWLLMGKGEMIKRAKLEVSDSEVKRENEYLKKELAWAKTLIKVLDKGNETGIDELLGKLISKPNPTGRDIERMYGADLVAPGCTYPLPGLL